MTNDKAIASKVWAADLFKIAAQPSLLAEIARREHERRLAAMPLWRRLLWRVRNRIWTVR